MEKVKKDLHTKDLDLRVVDGLTLLQKIESYITPKEKITDLKITIEYNRFDGTQYVLEYKTIKDGIEFDHKQMFSSIDTLRHILLNTIWGIINSSFENAKDKITLDLKDRYEFFSNAMSSIFGGKRDSND